MKYTLAAFSILAFSASAIAESSGDMPPYTPKPGPRAGNWEATLSGAGLSDDSFDSNNFGVNGSIGYYLNKNFILTFKQGMFIGDNNNSTLINGRSVVQAAYQWDLDRWQPYVGMNVGGVYGAAVSDEAIFGPEIGVKYYVNESTFLYGNMAYEVPFDNCCRGGVIPYNVGVGFNF
jgi:hypothetical protein